MKYTLLITVFAFIFAQANPERKETYKDIIQKAYSLSLQQQRLQAAQILQRALENEVSKKAQNELLKTLEEVTAVFYTEKGQSVYEYGRSLFRSSPLEAVEKFKEAQKLEPNHVLISLQLSRVYLLLGRCEDSDVAATAGLKVHPKKEEFFLLQAQARACTQKHEEAQEPLKKISESVYLFVTQAQVALLKQDLAQARTYIALAKAVDPDFPEIYFWEMQVRKKEGESFQSQILKYTRSCRGMTTKDYLKYEKEPRMCQEYKNLETEFKNIIENESKKEI